MEKNNKGIVILGHPRSGTTLTRRLINAHSRIACPPETHLFSACSRFLESEKTAHGVDIGALAGLNFAGESDEKVLNKLRQFAFSFLEDYAQREGKVRWAEKTAFDAFNIQGIEQLCAGHASFVGIVRHPLDVAISSIKFCDSMGFYPKEMHKYICEYPQPIEAFARSWLDVSDSLKALQQRQNGPCKIFRYEDIANSPKETMTELLGFLGEEFEDGVLEKGLQQDKSLGFGDHKSYQSKSVHRNSVGKWHSLPPFQLQKLAPILNPSLEYFGYELLEEGPTISVANARQQYLKGMDIVSQRGLNERTVEPQEDPQKQESYPRISIYGHNSQTRSGIQNFKTRLLGSAIYHEVKSKLDNPGHLFAAALLVLLKRIGEENTLTLGYKDSFQSKSTLPFKLDAKEDITFGEVVEQFTNAKGNELKDFDVTLDFLLTEKIPEDSKSNNSGIHALSLSVREMVDKADYELSFAFDNDVWPTDDMQMVAIEHFVNILSAAVDSNLSIDDFSFITEKEEGLLHNAEQFNEPLPTFVETFIKQVRENPQHIAVVYEDESLTYADLGHRVATLSAHLRAKGVEQGATVAVCLERSTDLLTSLLAVLHSGAAYIPIDPDFPQSRINQILDDAQPHYILAEEITVKKLDAKFDNRTYCLDSELWQQAISNDLVLGSHGELAYIIFTSGSTGRPKGVEVYHHGLSTFLSAMAETPGLESSDRLLSVTTVSFDIAALELFLPLSVGATVYIASRKDTIDGRALGELMIKHRITCFQATPATYHLLLGAGWTGNDSIKLLCGGEALPPELSESLIGKCTSLWNMYGPTETTIWSTTKKVEHSISPMPIGRPIKGTNVYVLNNKQTKVPVGVAGELYISGAGISKGYFNRPDLTEKNFISDPFVDNPTAKMYRTGDLVRVQNDGDIVYLGRLDNQVKIRGYRIELGDIESAIAKMPEVAQCVVGVQSQGEKSKSLVAYVILENGKHVDITCLRNFLKPLIPGYMLPSYLKQMVSFPLTPNNKINRKALPELEESDFLKTKALANDNHPVKTEKNYKNQSCEEEIIASLQNIMALSDISPGDSFVSLGGDSLSFVQTTIELERILGTLPDDWENTPIAELASPQIDKSEIKPPIKEELNNNFTDVDTSIFIRAFAIASIVFLHALPGWGIHGNTGALFIVAGFLFAKFQFDQICTQSSVTPILKSSVRIFIPSTIVMGGILLMNDTFRLDVILLYSNFTVPISTYWYVQALIQILLFMAAIFLIKPVLLFAKHEPLKFGMYLTAFAVMLLVLSPLFEPDHGKHRQLPQVRLWQFAIGWCIFYCQTRVNRLTIAHLLVLVAGIQFLLLDRELGLEDPIVTIVLGILLMTHTKITIIKPLNYLIYALAGASLFIFLSHRQFFAIVHDSLSLNNSLESVIAFVVALGGGYLLWFFWELLSRNLWKGKKNIVT